MFPIDGGDYGIIFTYVQNILGKREIYGKKMENRKSNRNYIYYTMF